MINVKSCRHKFLLILQNLCSLDDINLLDSELLKLKKLKKYIKSEYFYDNELPQISHHIIEALLTDIDLVENLLIEYCLSRYYKILDGLDKKWLVIIERMKKLINKYSYVKKSYTTKSSKKELNNIIKIYKQIFGDELVEKSLEEGLNILKNTKDTYFNQKKIDYIYPPKVIEKYLRVSLISNIIFLTKNLGSVDTNKIIQKVKMLKGVV